MLNKLLFAAIGVAILVGAIVYAKLDQFSSMGEAAESMMPPPETVTAMTVVEAQWEQSIPATATVSAVQGVTVGAEIGGRVTRIGFASGETVTAGEVLLRLDTASEAAQLASAEATAAWPGRMSHGPASWAGTTWCLERPSTGPRPGARRVPPRSTTCTR